MPYLLTYSGPLSGEIMDITDSEVLLDTLPSGDYTALATDAIGCTSTVDFTINAGVSCGLSCQGDLLVTIEADSLGILLDIPAADIGDCPLSILQYDLSGELSLLNGTGAVGVRNFPVGITTVSYYVVGQDTCSFDIIIEQANSPCDSFFISPTSISAPRCFGGNDGAIELIIGNGLAPYHFIWSSGDTIQNPTELRAGLHVLTVTDENSCEISASFWLQSPNILSLSCEQTILVSTANGTDGEAMLTFSGGTPPYRLSDGGILFHTTGTSGTFTYSNLAVGTHPIVITDANDCIANCSLEILADCTIPELPDFTPVVETCIGSIPVLSLEVEAGQTVDWYDNTGQELAIGVLSYQPETIGTYYASIRDIATACVSEQQAGITIILDQEAPVFESCPDDIDVILNVAQETMVTADWTPPTATDNCSVENITGNYNPGDTFSSSQTVTYIAEDELGNTNVCTFDINVIETDELLFYIDSSHTSVVGDTAMVAVCVKNFNNIHGFQLGLELIDAYGSKIVGVENIHTALQSNLIYNIPPNDTRLEAEWGDIAGGDNSPELSLPDSTSIFKLKLVLESSFGGCSDLIFDYENYIPHGFSTQNENIIASALDGRVCKPTKGSIAGNIHRANNSPIANVNVMLKIDGLAAQETQTDAFGNYRFDELPLGRDYEVIPYLNDNPNLGVSLVDITIVRYHIFLNGEGTYLDTPYKLIAADLTDNGSISLTDLTSLMYLLIYGELPSSSTNTSWRFVVHDYLFPNPENPWTPPFVENKKLIYLDRDALSTDFIGIKIGDVN